MALTSLRPSFCNRDLPAVRFLMYKYPAQTSLTGSQRSAISRRECAGDLRVPWTSTFCVCVT